MMLASSAVVLHLLLACHDRVFSARLLLSSREELNKVVHGDGRSPSNSIQQAGTTLHLFFMCLVCRLRAVEAADLHRVGPAALVGGGVKLPAGLSSEQKNR